MVVAFMDSKPRISVVYLVLTPQGLQEILNALDAVKTSIWCSADALSEREFDNLERGNVTRLHYSLADADKATMQDAIATIEEHHPGERVWIESVMSKT